MYIKPIKIYIYIKLLEWLGNGWGVCNLCALLRRIPGRGLFTIKKLFHHKNIRRALFIKGPDF